MPRKFKFVLASLCFGVFVSVSPFALARIGVGVGTGKIVVDEALKPGIIYELPSLTVLNTGDEPSEYEVGVAYHQDQPQNMPPKEWFTFRPSRFYLEPAKSQEVEITLTLPVKTEQGDYFAYLEGYPVKKQNEDGTTSIGIAAAAKLYFTVAPANFLAGVFYRMKSMWSGSQPYSSIFVGLVLVVLIARYVRSKVNISININKKSPDARDEINNLS